MPNVVVLDGNLGQDAKIQSFPSGKQVAKFSIGVRQGKDKPTLWVNIEAWEQPDFIVECLRKGRHVVVSGQLCLNKYTDTNGVQRENVFVGFAKIDLGREPLQGQQRTKTKAQMQEEQNFTEDDIPY